MSNQAWKQPKQSPQKAAGTKSYGHALCTAVCMAWAPDPAYPPLLEIMLKGVFPPMLFCSSGGHVDSFAILPLQRALWLLRTAQGEDQAENPLGTCQGQGAGSAAPTCARLHFDHKLNSLSDFHTTVGNIGLQAVDLATQRIHYTVLFLRSKAELDES